MQRYFRFQKRNCQIFSPKILLPKLKLNENTPSCSEGTKNPPLSVKEEGQDIFFLSVFCLAHDLSHCQ